MRPRIGDVPKLLTTICVQQSVDVESLVVDVVRHPPVESRQAIAHWDHGDVSGGITQSDRHAPIGTVPPRTGTERKVRRPEVARDSFGQLIALTDPDDEALIVRSERAVRTTAIRAERRGKLVAATDKVLSVDGPDLLTSAELEDVEVVPWTRRDGAYEFRHIESGENAAGSIVDETRRPVERLSIENRDVHGRFPGLVGDHAGIDPLARETGSCRLLHRQDLSIDDRLGV